MVIINSIIKWQVKNYAKGCTRAMLSSALAFKEHCKGQPMTYAFLARKALSTRPNWKQINETEFIFTKTNNSITITEEMSLKNVIDLVVAEELIDSLNNMSKSEYDNLLQIALEEVNKTLSIKR